MILAFVWTFLAFIGIIGSIRNVYRRQQNAKAIKQLRLNGPAMLTATTFRNSEVIRMGQAVIGLIIGVTAITFYQSPYYRAILALQATGQFPQPPIVIIYRNVIQWGLFLWMVLLVLNIWYFGLIGDRVERLRRRTHHHGRATDK